MTDRDRDPAAAAPALSGLLSKLRDDPAIGSVLGRREATVACPSVATSMGLAGLVAATRRAPVVVIVPTDAEAERIADDLSVFFGADEVELFPGWETLPFERLSPSVSTMGRRLAVLHRLASSPPAVVVASTRAASQRLGPHVTVEPRVVRRSEVVDLTSLVEQLVSWGYVREYQVEHRGEFAVRGSIVDVFPPTADRPVRIDLWGDEVDRLTTFAVGDQRADLDVDEVMLVPCRELRPTDEVRARAAGLVEREPWGAEWWQRLADGEIFDGMESWLPWLVDETDGATTLFDVVRGEPLAVLVDPRRIRDRAAEVVDEESALASSLAARFDAGSSVRPLHLAADAWLDGLDWPVWSLLSVSDSPSTPTIAAERWHPVAGGGERLVGQLRALRGGGTDVVAVADSPATQGRVEKILRDNDVSLPVVIGPLSGGAVMGGAGLAILAESDLIGRRRVRRPSSRALRDAQRFFEDLQVGGFVVHETHGVSRYLGLSTREIDDVERDYLTLEFKGGDRLYVPTDQIDSVRHYSGGDAPSLSKMGGADFARTKAKVRSEVAAIAQELVVLYQTRLARPGHAFSADTPWQAELEQSFPFDETPDQLTAIAAVKADMERPVPMDRLVCGDVGFGKTEVAVRAVFKAVQDGKQAAVLVPTTLLAQQHHATFSDRFAAYPVRVEVLSRFASPADVRAILAGLADGSVDVVIGTHRLLGGDVRFKDLGLLVVDEEQRFGVNHKELIKQMRTDVDVLTMSATPIPRTLEMSLAGIRDMSLLQTAPAERQPILTFVGDYDDEVVSEAIRRELLREGQLFFVHNRVASIDRTAERLRDLVPEARIAVAHGQMDEAALETVVVDFWEQRYDVLVCTTIIESGIDMPTVNTLVVDRADLLGLGQLHQLRGRVGRAGQRAYAYLFTPAGRSLTEEAYERLKTIGEATALGSGFRIAMRDLEIRGAGNLLGTGQSGHISSIGYDLYCQMVNEAIADLNGEVAEPSEPAVVVELPVDAGLPDTYIEREDLRLEAYRRLHDCVSDEQVADVERELSDRFGPPPDEAAALVGLARLRAECHRIGVASITTRRNPAFGAPPLLALIEPIELAQSKQLRLARRYPKATWEPSARRLTLPIRPGPKLLDELLDFVAEMVPPPRTTGTAESAAEPR